MVIYRRFIAEFESICPRCDGKINPGEFAHNVNHEEGNNICHVCRKELYAGDMLIKQAALQREVFDRDLEKLRGVHWEQAIMEMSLALYGEVGEYFESMKLLPWKNKKTRNLKMAVEELIDIQHFLNNLYILHGITNERMMRKAFDKKLNTNIQRGSVHESPSHDN